jgi:hypothetical protein
MEPGDLMHGCTILVCERSDTLFRLVHSEEAEPVQVCHNLIVFADPAHPLRSRLHMTWLALKAIWRPLKRF